MISKISKVFSRSEEQLFLTVGQNNFGYKIPLPNALTLFLSETAVYTHQIDLSPLNLKMFHRARFTRQTSNAMNRNVRSREAQNNYMWYFVAIIVLTSCEKKTVLVIIKNVFKFSTFRLEFAKFLRLLKQFIRTEHCSEGSEQFYKWNTFLCSYWRF